MGKILQFNFDYKSTQYQIEKSTTKAIALVDKIDNMLQRRQIINAVGKQIDTEDPIYIKHVIKSFQSIVWMLKSVNVTIYRTVPIQRCQGSSHCIMMTTAKLRSCI